MIIVNYMLFTCCTMKSRSDLPYTKGYCAGIWAKESGVWSFAWDAASRRVCSLHWKIGAVFYLPDTIVKSADETIYSSISAPRPSCRLKLKITKSPLGVNIQQGHRSAGNISSLQFKVYKMIAGDVQVMEGLTRWKACCGSTKCHWEADGWEVLWYSHLPA